MECFICKYSENPLSNENTGHARSNVKKFKDKIYTIWKCPKCLSLHTLDKIKYKDLYEDYILNKRTLDYFAYMSYKNLFHRLKNLKRNNLILDFGSGQPIFQNYLEKKGFERVFSYDPWIPKLSSKSILEKKYDYIIANDVLEHLESPRDLFNRVLPILKPGGFLYVGMPDTEGIKNIKKLDKHLMTLHLPFHRTIISQQSLKNLGKEYNLKEIRLFKRSYMDTFMPFVNYRFLNELNCALGHVMDKAFDSNLKKVFLRNPLLFFWGFCGYFLPCAIEPAILWRKNESRN